MQQDYGYEITPYRSKNHFRSLISVYGASGEWFRNAPVYKTFDGGNYVGCAMKRGSCPDWRVADGGDWWLRDSPFGEPNGDYHANCWLQQYTWK